MHDYDHHDCDECRMIRDIRRKNGIDIKKFLSSQDQNSGKDVAKDE